MQDNFCKDDVTLIEAIVVTIITQFKIDVSF